MAARKKAPGGNPWGRKTATERGYRSGLEDKIAAELKAAKVKADYESVTLRYTVPARTARYTPDWILPNGIIVESKGRFVTSDRTKHRLIREQFPQLDIRFVFSNSRNKIGKKSATTYGMWCERLGIKYADKSIPDEWLKEPAKPLSLEVIATLSSSKKD